MKILFIECDHRFIFGLPLGFRDAGHKVVVTGKITFQKLNEILMGYKPELVILLGWSIMHNDENIKIIRDCLHRNKSKLIYWATEDPTFINDFSIPLTKKLLPSYIFTVSNEAIRIYAAHGFKASFIPFGYQPSIFKYQKATSCNYTLSMIANAYPNVLAYDKSHYRKTSMNILLRPLLKSNIKVDIWGNNWDKMSPYLSENIPSDFLHGSIHYLKTNPIYQNSEMILCLQNYREDVIAMRTYEILGAGGFLITSTHDVLKTLFTANKDFIMIDSEEEMLEKYAFYLKNPSLRRHIKEKGMKSANIHTYQNRAEEMIKILKKEHLL